VIGAGGAAKARAGGKNAALQALTDLNRMNRELYGYARPLLWLSLDRQDEALRWLERALEDRDGSNAGWIKVDPLLEQLHGHPRFEALVKRVVAPKQTPNSEAKLLRRTEAAQCLQSRGRLRGGVMAVDPSGVNLVSDIRCAGVGDEGPRRSHCAGIAGGADFLLGIRDHARRNCARIGGPD
jgi:hypothetical protein